MTGEIPDHSVISPIPTMNVAARYRYTYTNVLSRELTVLPFIFPPSIRRRRTRHNVNLYSARKMTTTGIVHASMPQATTLNTKSLPHKPVLSNKRFADTTLSKDLLNAIPHEFMTDTQAAIFDLALDGQDLIVQTEQDRETDRPLAFLLPIIERVLRSSNRQGISALILCPTPEFAVEVERDAAWLVRNQGLTVESIVDGTDIHASVEKIIQRPPTILIANPGPLHDFLISPNVQAPFQTLQALVLENTDDLINEKNAQHVVYIIEKLANREDRKSQVLLFSSSINGMIKRFADEVLDRAFVVLAQKEGRPSEHAIITPFANTLPLALHLLRANRAARIMTGITHSALMDSLPTLRLPRLEGKYFYGYPPLLSPAALSTSKSMVVLPTFQHGALAYIILGSVSGLPRIWRVRWGSELWEKRAISEFNKAEEGILICSNHGTRAVDYSGINLFLNLNFPGFRDSLLRASRKVSPELIYNTREILILDPTESPLLQGRETRELDISADPLLGKFASNPKKGPRNDVNSLNINTNITEAKTEEQDLLFRERAEIAGVLTHRSQLLHDPANPTAPINLSAFEKLKIRAYTSWIWFYNQHLELLGWDKQRLVDEAKKYAKQVLMWKYGLPPFDVRLAKVMDLETVKGLNVQNMATKQGLRSEDTPVNLYP